MWYGQLGSSAQAVAMELSIGEGTVFLYCKQVSRALRQLKSQFLGWPDPACKGIISTAIEQAAVRFHPYTYIYQYIMTELTADMRTMPIRSESNQINTIKQKKSKKCEGPGQPILLRPPKCEHNMK